MAYSEVDGLHKIDTRVFLEDSCLIMICLDNFVPCKSFASILWLLILYFYEISVCGGVSESVGISCAFVWLFFPSLFAIFPIQDILLLLPVICLFSNERKKRYRFGWMVRCEGLG